MKTSSFRLRLLAACVLLPAVARAQAPAPIAIDIPDIRVEASRGMQLRDMDVSTTIVTREEVQATPELTTDQIVNHIAGVYLSQVPTTGVHPTGQSITLRGMGGRGAERTLVMVDGVPFNDAFFRYINWSKIPKESIERIEVIRGGGATSLWGNMAMGGVINIVTHEPQAGERRASVSLGYPDTVNFDAAATVFANEYWKAAISASYAHTAGYNETPAAYRNQHTVKTAAEAQNVGAQAIVTPTADSRYFMKILYHSINEKGLVFDIAKNGWTGVDLTFGGRTKFDDGSVLEGLGWYGNNTITTHNASSSGYTYTNPASGNGAATYLAAIGKTPYYDYGGSLVWSRDLNDTFTDVKAGIDARNIVGGDSTQVISQAGAATAFSQVHGQQWFQGLFAQATVHLPWLPLDITVGLREDFWKVSEGSFNHAALPEGRQYARFDPRLGLKYKVTENFDLRAAVYRNFGAPGMNQTFRTYYSGNTAFQANAALAPEYNLGYETGADLRLGPVTLTGNIFHNNLTNVIDSTTICGAAGLPSCATSSQAIGNTTQFSKQSKYYNVGKAEVEGFEILADWRVSDTLRFNASYTMSSSILTDNSGLATIVGRTVANTAEPLHAQLGNVPPWSALAGLTWTPTPKYRVTLNLKGFPTYWYDTAHTIRNDGAALLDISASYKPAPGLELFVTGQNIGNTTYVAQGSTGSSTPPVIGQPLFFLVGMRVNL